MRKYYFDNLRSFIIYIALIPFHFSLGYTVDINYYVCGEPLKWPLAVIMLFNDWTMPALFLLAGICSSYSLSRKSRSAFFKDRFIKLFIPFLAGSLIIDFPIAYCSSVAHGNFTGSVWEFIKKVYPRFWTVFYNPEADYGCGWLCRDHLWFLFYLMIFSLILLVVCRIKLPEKVIRLFRKPYMLLLPVALMIPLKLLMVETPCTYSNALMFFLGYFLLKDDEILECITNNRNLYWSAFLVAIAAFWFASYCEYTFLMKVTRGAIAWFGSLGFLGLFGKYQNTTSKFKKLLADYSMQFYIVHQSVLVILMYYFVRHTDSTLLQFCLIIPLTYIISALSVWIIANVPPFRFLFGLPVGKRSKQQVELPKT